MEEQIPFNKIPLDNLGPLVGSPVIPVAMNIPGTSAMNEYDKGHRRGYNQTWNRSSNQSGLEQLGSGLVSRTLSIAPKLGAGFGSIVGVGMAAWNQDASQIWDNPINNWFNELDESIKETLPVYNSYAYDNAGGLLDKLSTTSFWANDAFDGIAYAASAYVPGAIIGKGINAAAKGLKTFDLGKDIVGGLRQVGLNSQRANLITSTAYNVVSEASAEAFQTQKELEAIYREKGLDPKAAKEKAAESAARVFNSNLLALAGPDLIQNMLFHGGWNKIQDKVRTSIWDKVKAEEVTSLWKKIGGSVASEGFWEENIQNSLQAWEKNAALSGNNGDDRVSEIAYSMANNIGAFFNSFVPGKEQTPEEVEAATAIFLGWLIGTGAATLGHFKEKAALKKETAYEQGRYDNMFNTAGKTAMGIFSDNVASILKLNPETKGRKVIKEGDSEITIRDFALDENGNTILDEQAAHKLTLNTLRNKALWDAEMVAQYTGDKSIHEINKQVALGSYVYALMNNNYEYTAEEVGKFLDQATKLGTAEAEAEGFETMIKENMDTAKQYAKQLETIRGSRSTIAKDAKADPADASFNDFMNRTEFYLNLKKKALENIVNGTTTDVGKEAATKVLEDVNGFLNDIKNEPSAIRKEYEKNVLGKQAKLGAYQSATVAEEKNKIAYELEEEAAIEGIWNGTNNSRTLPSLEARHATDARVGSRDFYNYNLGKTLLAVNRITTALANNGDIVDIASQFANNVKVVPDNLKGETAVQKSEILDRLNNEATTVQQERDLLLGILEFNASEEVQEDETIGDYLLGANGYIQNGNSTITTDEVEGLIAGLNEDGANFTADSSAEEVVASEQFKKFMNEAFVKTAQAAERLTNLDKLQKQVTNADIDNSRTKGFENATDKELFLRNEFYSKYAGDPAANLIEIFKSDEKAFEYELDYHEVKGRLEQAIAGATDEANVNDAKEKLQFFEDVIYPQLINNLNNRARVHIEINNRITNSILDSLPIKLIASHIGGDNLEALIDAIRQGEIVTFDGLLELLKNVKNLPKDAVDAIVEQLELNIDKSVRDSIDLLYPKYEFIQGLLGGYRTNGHLKTQVSWSMQALFNLHFNKKYGEKWPSEAIRFSADLDINLFDKSSEKSKELDVEDKVLIAELAKVYFNVVGYELASNSLKSTLDFDKLMEFKKTIPVKPSLQQNIALTQAVLFLTTKTTTADFGNWLLVRGIGGSGKSYFLGNQIKALNDMLKGQPTKYIAFSKEKLASENINKAINKKAPQGTTYEIFNSMTPKALAELDFVVIDEVFTFTNNELQDIKDKLNAANVKVIAMGDASQLTADPDPAINGALKVKMTIPLTTSYRTNIGAISSFIDKYRLNSKEVLTNVASSNVSPEDLVKNPALAYGVIATDMDTIDKALHMPSARSRVLIVDSTAAQESLSKVYVGVEVRTPQQAQGIQWDEVYSMLPTDVGDNAFEKNRNLYTAYSRAKELLVVAQPSLVNAKPTAALDKVVANAPNELAAMVKMFDINMDYVAQMRAIVNGTKKMTTAQTTLQEEEASDEPATDPGISGAMDTSDDVDFPDPVINNTGYRLFYPTNYGLTDGGIPNEQRLDPSKPAHFVKFRDTDGTIGYYIIAESKKQNVTTGFPKYFIVAQLGEKDFEGPAKEFFDKLSKVDKYTPDKSQYNAVKEFEIPDISTMSLGTIQIKDFAKFKTLYTPVYHTQRDLFPGANDIIEDAIIRSYATYYGLDENEDKNPKPWVTVVDGKYQVNWNNIPNDAVRITIPTLQDRKKGVETGWDSKIDNPRNIGVRNGVPYMVITMQEGKKPFLVRFQPRMLNTNNKYVITIRDFTANAAKLQELTGLYLGTEEFAKLVRDYKTANYIVVEEGDTRKIVPKPTVTPVPGYPPSNELEEAMQKVVEAVFFPEEKNIEFRTEEDAKEYLEKNGIPEVIGGVETGRRILNGNKTILSIQELSKNSWSFMYAPDSTDLSITKAVQEWIVAEGSGKIQIALNSLAKANNRIDKLQFRQTAEKKKSEQEKKENRNPVKITRSPSVLLSKPYIDYAGFYRDPVIARLLTSDQIFSFQKLATSSDPKEVDSANPKMLDALAKAIVEEDNVTYHQALDDANKMLNAYKTSPITTDLLHTISHPDNFDENGEHTMLRTPLKIRHVTKVGTGESAVKTHDGIVDLGSNLHSAENRVKLTSELRHNFEGFQQSRIFFDSPELEKIEVSKPPSKILTIKDILQTIGDTNIPTYDAIVRLLKSINFNADIIPAQVQTKGPDGNVITEPFAYTIVLGDKTLIQTSGLDLSKASTNIGMLHMFLHESMHGLTKAALDKGLTDYKAKIDSKEARFYRNMQTLQKRFNAAVKAKKDPVTGKRIKLSDVYQRTFSPLDVNEFVANLANPEFVELAKSINVAPETSFLRRMLQAIIDLFKDILGDNPSVYNAAVALIEDFYSNQPTAMPKYVAPQVIYNVADTIDTVNKAISNTDEFTFTNTIARLKKQYQGILDPDSFPEDFLSIDDATITTTFGFDELTDQEKSDMIARVNASAAYYDLPKDRLTFGGGTIRTSAGITRPISKLLSDTQTSFTSAETKLLNSIVMFQLQGNETFNRINNVTQTPVEVLTYLFDKVLSKGDKQKIRDDNKVKTDEEALKIILNGDLGVSMMRVVDFVNTNVNPLNYIVENSRNSSTDRYRMAKAFVEDIILQNLLLDKRVYRESSPTPLMKTLAYLREDIVAIAGSENPTLVSFKVIDDVTGELRPGSLVEAKVALDKAYKEIEELQSQRSNKENTKRLNELVTTTIPNLENEIAAVMSLRQTIVGTNDTILDRILADIYPSADLELLSTYEEELFDFAETEYYAQSELRTDMLELSGIAEHLKTYNKSYEDTLSESLKNSFRKIVLGNKVISPGLAYIKTLQLVMSLDWNIHTNEGVNTTAHPLGLAYITKQLTDKLENKFISSLNRVIIENLINTISYATTKNFLGGISVDFKERAMGIAMYKNPNNGAIEYVAYEADATIPHSDSLTYQELQLYSNQGLDVKVSSLSRDTTELYEWLNRVQSKPVTTQQFNRMFAKADALNTIRAIHNTMASMKETTLYTANRTTKRGHEFRFQRAVASGVSTKMKDQLKTNLITFYEEGELNTLRELFDSKEFFGQKIADIRNNSEKRLEYIKYFFSFMGIEVTDLEIKGKSINEVINKIDGFLTRTKEVQAYSVLTEGTDEADNTFDVFEWLETHVDGDLNFFSNVLAASDTLVRNQSVRDMNGDKFYSNHESSHIYDTLLNLAELHTNNGVFKGGTGSDFNRVIPKFLKSPIANPEEVLKGADPIFLDSYYDHNIFVRGKATNVIHGTVEIDGARNLSNNVVTGYQRENMAAYYHRAFSQQFLDSVRQFKDSYFQSTFIPSDSPKALAIRVGILSDNPTTEQPVTYVEKAIQQMFSQILRRKDLEGSKIKSFDESIKKDLFRNFSIGEQALKQAQSTHPGLKFTAENIPLIAKFAYDLMSIEAEQLFKQIANSEVGLLVDTRSYEIALKLEDKLNKKQFGETIEKYKTKINGKPIQAKTKIKGEYQETDIQKMMLPIFDLWFKNNYINSYFVNQIVLGDYAAYKNSGQLIKRFSGAKGPRIRGLIDSVAGMRPTRKSLILSDSIYSKKDLQDTFSRILYDAIISDDGTTILPDGTVVTDENMKELMPEVFGIMSTITKPGYESTDAGGFFTTRWMAELSRGFEAAWGLGGVSKPIHFGVEQEVIGDYTTGKPFFEKYSATHLSKEMTDKFPLMKKFNRILEKLKVDEVIFGSGTKVGAPVLRNEKGEVVSSPTMYELLNYTDEQINALDGAWQVSPILELDNASFGFQFNAASDPNKQVSLFTQLMYFLNAYPDKLANGEFDNVQEAAREVYTLVGSLIASGREDFFKKVGDSKKGLTNYLKKNLKGAGSERALQLLEASISLDNPLVEKKAIIALASGLEKATVKTKFKGGKLVLQSPEGMSKYKDLEFFGVDSVNNPEAFDALDYRKETLPDGGSIIVAECIVPRDLLSPIQIEALRRKESIYLMPDMLGFRLPSTEFHSALAIRVVGIYSTDKTNVIIAPRGLVPIQGQDFDVDALFVITQETFDKDEIRLTNSTHFLAFTDHLQEVLDDIQAAIENYPKYQGELIKTANDIKKHAGLTHDPEIDLQPTLLGKTKRLLTRLDGLKRFPELSGMYKQIMDNFQALEYSLENNTAVGERFAPVGYILKNGKYIIDTSFLEAVNREIDSLKSIKIRKEIAESTVSELNTAIKTAERLRDKYIKNRIIDIMMMVVSDRKSAERSFNAITFGPLDDIINELKSNEASAKLIKGNDNLDLSHAGQQFQAYLSVSSGEALIGAFANGSKSFGYTARAGGNAKLDALFELRSQLAGLEKMFKDNPSFANFDFIPSVKKAFEELNLDFSTIDAAVKKEIKPVQLVSSIRAYIANNKNKLFEANWDLTESVPILNKNQVFSIRDGKKTVIYDKLAQMNSDGTQRTTQMFSTLTNAAVDDLNEGYLTRARINTNTGAAMIGMTALGVPFRIAIKLLYQPILSGLSGGKVSRVENWISEVDRLFDTSIIDEVDSTPLSVEELDEFLTNEGKHMYQNMSLEKMKDTMSEAEKRVQKKVLNIFLRANKVGTDFKNLASTLNVLRKWDVLVEDIEQVYDNISDNIGKLTYIGNDLTIIPKSDFSFNIPQLLEGSPHIKEALISHRQLLDKISESFTIHSPEIKAIAETVRTGLNLESADKANVMSVDIRRSLQAYLTAGLTTVTSELPEPKITTYTKKADPIKKEPARTIKFITSGQTVFITEVSEKMKLIKDFAKAQGHSNLFLEHLVPFYDKFLSARLIFRVGVGLKDSDQQDIMKGFRELNRYSVVDGKVVYELPESPYATNQLQRDLINYSILTTGIQYGGTGFSSYISPEILLPSDTQILEELKNLVTTKPSAGFIQHFTLSYTLMNATKLPWVLYDNLVYTGEGKDKMYGGIDIIDEKPIYFDRKVRLETTKSGAIKSPHAYIKTEFSRDITVHKLVAVKDDIAYYQFVGKANNISYKPVAQDSNYDLGNYFDPTKAYVYFNYKKDDKIQSSSPLLNSLNPGDQVYIYPSYEYDRMSRQLVTIKDIKRSEVFKSFEVTIEPVVIKAPEANTASGAIYNMVLEKLQEEGKIERICKIN